MDIENCAFSKNTEITPPQGLYSGSCELTGFNGPSHYHQHCLINEEKSKLISLDNRNSIPAFSID